MSVMQAEDLVAYQLRASYLNEIADGVGERLITLNDGFLNTGPFKATGWRSNPALVKRTYSPPIPTAIASEYFQAPLRAGHTLEDEPDVFGRPGGSAMGSSTVTTVTGPKRRRRREHPPDQEDDSSDMSDESDDDTDQTQQVGQQKEHRREPSQLKFAKMPVRSRAGSSPLQNSSLRPPVPVTSSPRSSPSAPLSAARRGSQSALETVKERPRRDTVTSSEVSSENELDTMQRQRAAAAAAAAVVARVSRVSARKPPTQAQAPTAHEDDDEDDSDASSAGFPDTIDSVSILDTVEHSMQVQGPASPTAQVVGTPPRKFTRRSTIRKSQAPILPRVLAALPPARPISSIRPLSVIQPKSLLSEAFKKKGSGVPFASFANLSGQGEQKPPICVRIFAPFSNQPSTPFEVQIRREVTNDTGIPKPVTVVQLIGLSLLRYIEEKREPPLPENKMGVNWWTLRMMEDGEVDDDFPPLERTKPLVSFITANNGPGSGGGGGGGARGRGRANSAHYDDFALVMASDSERRENLQQTGEFADEEADMDDALGVKPAASAKPIPQAPYIPPSNLNPLLTTTYRNHNIVPADKPQAPVSSNPTRGQQKLLRIHILTSDVAAGQLVTVDVTTDMYLAEVLDMVCRRRQLDKANHVLKIPGSGAVARLDRPVASIGNVSDLELYRRRFATDGPLTVTGSPASASPNVLPLVESQMPRRGRRQFMGTHPLTHEALKQEELGSANYKKYTVWRKQPMRIVGTSERSLVIDGEYVHIIPATGVNGKTTTVHFSNVVGCKVLRKHPTNLKLMVYKGTESKRYDFEAKNADEANEIVQELKKGIAPYLEQH
ncbi:hypothetical protein TD95_000400 [Thielaviopsis punctulata]|uniref:Uncharacterized protein n=1 Tax=Thielaviopsis punctulata TaxID=72032 RepID=A0A0F4ZA44_9PEZI|nr:hypothetical protein TD95_000400 [Thielaviopsis punctulata]